LDHCLFHVAKRQGGYPSSLELATSVTNFIPLSCRRALGRFPLHLTSYFPSWSRAPSSKAFAERPDLKKRTYDAIGTMVIPPCQTRGASRAGRLMLRSAIPTTHNPARGHSYLHTNATNVANHLIYQRRPSTLQETKARRQQQRHQRRLSPSPSEWKPGYRARHVLPSRPAQKNSPSK
jgi:hypothetical protein